MADIVSFRPNRNHRRQQTPASSRFHKARHKFNVRARRYAGLLILLVTLAAAFYAFEPWQSQSPPTHGLATVVDGDTLRMGNERIRLVGIDAPEIHQSCRDASDRVWSCGRAARERLVALVSGAEVACNATGQDKYGRTLAACTSAGNDLGETLVREGFAIADGKYRFVELIARLKGRGLWAGEFQRPSEWRKAHKY
jgi:endonuclease YncB( thermonuclease family)